MSYDNYGVTYENGVLKKAPSTLTDYIILSSCHTIQGGTKESDSPFADCTKCTEIKFGANSELSSIGNYAFASFENLEKIDFTNCGKLKTIPNYCFYNSHQLTEVILPDSLTTFGQECFRNTTALKSLKCPDSVTTLGYRMLRDSGVETFEIGVNSKITNFDKEKFAYAKIKSIFIPKTVTTIEGSVFMYCSQLTAIKSDNTDFQFLDDKQTILDKYGTTLVVSIATGDITIPEKVTNLGYACLRGKYITSVTFLAGRMKSFSQWCLSSIPNLKTFTFPPGIPKVPDDSFSYDYQLKSITLTDEITEIGNYAFQYCSSLQTIDLKNVTKIGNGGFNQCTELGNVVFPPSLTELGSSVFSYCPNLQIDSSQNGNFHIVEGMLFIPNPNDDSADKNMLSEFFGQQKEVSIPNICKYIGRNVFSSKQITTVTFKDVSSEIQILSGAFSDSSIQYIDLPLTLTNIETGVFKGCKNLERVTFSNESDITAIPSEFFSGCIQLSNVTLPSSLELIGTEAFFSCTSLNSIDLNNTDLKTINESAFKQSAIKSIALPISIDNIEREAFMNSELETIEYHRESNINTISSSCFAYATNLKTVTLPDSIEVIESKAFYHCESLAQITLPQSIQTLQDSCFEYCLFLQTVSLSKDCNLQEIRSLAFGSCPLLHNISVPADDNHFKFEDGALLTYNYSNLLFFLPTSTVSLFVVPATVETINSYAFDSCKNLRTIIIPAGNIKSIGYRAFAECSKLSTLYIPRGITTIAQQVFVGCSSLECGSIITFPEVIDLLQDRDDIESIYYSTNCPSKSFTLCDCRSYMSYSFSLSVIILGFKK